MSLFQQSEHVNKLLQRSQGAPSAALTLGGLGVSHTCGVCLASLFAAAHPRAAFQGRQEGGQGSRGSSSNSPGSGPTTAAAAAAATSALAQCPLASCCVSSGAVWDLFAGLLCTPVPSMPGWQVVTGAGDNWAPAGPSSAAIHSLLPHSHAGGTNTTHTQWPPVISTGLGLTSQR